MRIISYNVNGIRAAIKKGLLNWLKEDNADIVCLQETKATKDDVDIKQIEALGYHTFWYSANKKGYSGVAIFSKQKPKEVIYGTGITQSDFEGRVIEAVFENFSIINTYFPSGTSGDERQTYKYQFLAEMQAYVKAKMQQQPNLILLGDYNICHTAIDIHDPKGNKNSSGFLPEERAWMDGFFADGWVDTFRCMNPDVTGAYTWWSQRFPTVREQNKGWRIDYIAVTKPLEKSIVSAGIIPNAKHSDHCPIFLTL